jgi:hypothetical protein
LCGTVCVRGVLGEIVCVGVSEVRRVLLVLQIRNFTIYLQDIIFANWLQVLLYQG